MNSFEFEADRALENLYEKLSENPDLDINFSDGVLTINAPNGEYAINKHNATQQIWFSSPVSSLKYFILQEGKFVERGSGIGLEEATFIDLIK